MIDRTARLSATEFAKTFPKIPSLQLHRVRCGKGNCRCSQGRLHTSWRLVWRNYYGQQRRRYVRKAEVEAVRAIIERRQWIERERRQLIAESRAYLRLL